MIKEHKSLLLNKVSLPQIIVIVAMVFFMLIGVYFATQNNNNYLYKSRAQEVPTPTVSTAPKGVPRYNCQALCNQVFKIPENKVKCINPCNKVGDKVSQGMGCKTACDKSILNGARKQFCYKFCPAIQVGSIVTPTP